MTHKVNKLWITIKLVIIMSVLCMEQNIFQFYHVWLVKVRKIISLKMRKMSSLMEVGKTSCISHLPSLLSPPHQPNTSDPHPLTIPPPNPTHPTVKLFC